MRRTLLILASFAWLLALPVLAQQQPPPTPPPQNPPPQTPPTPPPATKPYEPGNRDVAQPSGREPDRPVYLTGCVQMDDGSTPPPECRVRLVGLSLASGTVRLDSQGCFRVQIGISGSRGLLSPMSDTSRLGVEVELPGYQVAGNMSNKNQSPFGDIDVGIYVLTRNEGGSTISINSLSAPDNARKAYINADKELKKKKTPNESKAFSELQKAVKNYPQYAAAWQLIGEIHDRKKEEDRAREAFQKAISADSRYVTPYLSLGNIELRNQRWAELARLSAALLRLSPDNVEGQYFQAVSQYRQQSFEVAERSARYVVDKKLADKYPSVHLILGDILAQRGEIAPAAEHFRSFLLLRPEGQNSQMVRNRLQAWEEQGILSKQ